MFTQSVNRQLELFCCLNLLALSFSSICVSAVIFDEGKFELKRTNLKDLSRQI